MTENKNWAEIVAAMSLEEFDQRWDEIKATRNPDGSWPINQTADERAELKEMMKWM
jgi:hypothetical protein